MRIASDSALGTPMMRRVKPGVVINSRNKILASEQERTWVDIDALETSDGVHAYDGVDRFDWFAADVKSRCACTVRLGDGAVQSRKAFEIFLEPGAQRRE